MVSSHGAGSSRRARRVRDVRLESTTYGLCRILITDNYRSYLILLVGRISGGDKCGKNGWFDLSYYRVSTYIKKPYMGAGGGAILARYLL